MVDPRNRALRPPIHRSWLRLRMGKAYYTGKRYLLWCSPKRFTADSSFQPKILCGRYRQFSVRCLPRAIFQGFGRAGGEYSSLWR